MKTIFIDTYSLMCEIKTKDVYEDFTKDKEILDFGKYCVQSKYYDDSDKLVVDKIKDKTGGVAIRELKMIVVRMKKQRV